MHFSCIQRYCMLAIATIILTVSVLPKGASAVPAFARLEGAECSLCHVGFPKLNEFGVEYRANGFRMEGEEGTYIWDAEKLGIGMVGTLQYENLDLESPLEAHPAEPANGGDDHGRSISGLAQVDDHDAEPMGGDHDAEPAAGDHEPAVSQASQKAETKTSRFDGGALLLYAGGTLAPHVSYFAHLLANDDQTTLALAYVIWMDIIEHAGLNLRMGKMAVDLPFLSSSRRLTITDYLLQLQAGGGGHGHGGATVSSCSACGASLVNEGIEANGIFDMGEVAVEYALGVGNDSVLDSENSVGAYHGLLSLTMAEQSLGVIFKHDRVGATESVQQDTDGIGVGVDLHFAGLNVMAAIAQFKQNVMHGDNINITSGTVEVMYPLLDNLLGVARYGSHDPDDSDEKTTQWVASLIYYLHPNLKFQAEVAQNKFTDHSGVDYDSNGVYGLVAYGF